MEGPQEFPSETFRLRCAPAASPRTSLLLLRLNEATLRALHDCHAQQVTRTLRPAALGMGGSREKWSGGGGRCHGTPRRRVPLPVGPAGDRFSRRPRGECEGLGSLLDGVGARAWGQVLRAGPRSGAHGAAAESGSLWGLAVEERDRVASTPGELRLRCICLLTSPWGSPFTLLATSGRKALASGERVASLAGLRGSFYPQYLRLPGPGWSCLLSFVLSPSGQELGSGSLELICQRLGR